MQTIKLNEGFDSLRRILKSKQIHPKSKAYVLYETAKHINGLQSKLHRLWSENIYLRKMVMGHHNAAMGTTLGTTLGTTITSPLPPNMTPALAASMATTLSPSMPANMGPTLATLAQYQHSPSLSRHRANSSGQSWQLSFNGSLGATFDQNWVIRDEKE